MTVFSIAMKYSWYYEYVLD